MPCDIDIDIDIDTMLYLHCISTMAEITSVK